MSFAVEFVEQHAGFSKLCFDCRDRLNTRHFTTALQGPLVSSGRKTNPPSHTLIHEYDCEPDILCTGQSRDCDLCTLLIHRPSYRGDDYVTPVEEQWKKKWTSVRWLARCRKTEKDLLDVEELLIQLFEQSYDPLDEESLAGVVDLYLDVRTTTGNPAAEYISSREFDTDHGSTANFVLANTWLKTCLHTHTTCGSQNSNPLLPTRVLDVGDSDGGVHLLEANGKSGKYIALSYCWGQKTLHRTIKASLAANLVSIDCETLSPTIKDAIKVTRSLGMRYIWIDALCIIQDSDDDKIKELANMGNIYENATLTVIAASAAGADEGFLRAKSTPEIDLRIPYGHSANPVGTLLLRTFETIDNVNKVSDPTEIRAWCFQESLLSIKCLVYSSFHLYWSCQEIGYANQDTHLESDIFKPVSRLRRHFVYNLTPLLKTKSKSKQLNPDDWSTLWHFWQEASSEYSSRHISFLRDRLPAISAVAQRIQAVSEDTYYAGIWKSNVYRQLFWGKQSESLWDVHAPWAQPRPDEYIAPTWSWLSCRGRIFYHSFQVDPDLKLENIQVELVRSSEPYGAVKSGRISLTGRLEEVSILSRFGNGLFWLGSKRRSLSEIYTCFGNGKGEAKGHPDATNELVEGMKGTWCLQGGLAGSSKCIGLILQQNGPENQFRRVGSFVTRLGGTEWFRDSELKSIQIV